jgi:peptidoglycan/xylan/chitin deacetylase (PgdA/CDA1 family)
MLMLFRVFLLLVAFLACAVPASAEKRIALTFDDVPRGPGTFMTTQERTDRLIAALRQAGVSQAAFFVNPGNLEQEWGRDGAAHIDAYVAAGHVIANHSYSHGWLRTTDAAAYVTDIDRATLWLQVRPGYRPWYRFPFLDEGGEDVAKRDVVRGALAARHLSNGYVTVDSFDWYLDQLLGQAARDGRQVDRAALHDLYVEMLVENAEFQERVAHDALGRSPAHVMLLHETDIAALFIADAVAALKARGWQIVTADEAYRDPIAATEPDTTNLGGGRVTALASLRGRPASELAVPLNNQAAVGRLFNTRVLHQAEAP